MVRQDKKRLNAMVDYCKTTRCFRGQILDYFGQDHGASCGNCGNCLGDFVRTDMTIPAQMVLSCVKRVRDKLGYPVGMNLLLDVLRGGRGQRVLALKLNEVSTYGLLAREKKETVRTLMDHLVQEGYLRVDPDHGGVSLTPAASEVLFRGKSVVLALRDVPKPKSTIPRVVLPAGEAPAEGFYDGLFQRLKEVRTRLAQRAGVPAYVVFSNATLADMAVKLPTNREEFLAVNGVGEQKADRYGKEFLAAILDFLGEETAH